MRMLLFLTSINILNYLDRYLVPALLPLIQIDFMLNKEQSGRLVSAFVLGYVVFSPIFGYLGDRMNRPLLMAIGVGVWSLATMASAYVATLVAFFLARAMIGIGEASFGTIAPGYIKDRGGGDTVAVNNALSIFFCAVPAGAALGYFLGGTIAAASSWRNALLICGFPGIALAAALCFLKEAPKNNVNLDVSLLRGVKEVLSLRVIRLAILGYILNSFALNGIAAFVTTHGVDLGFSIDAITQLFGGVLVVTGLLGTFVGGRIASALSKDSADPLSVMSRFCAIVSILAAPPLAAAFLVESKALFLVFAFFAELLVFASVGPINSVLVLGAPKGLVTLTQGVTIFAINLFGAATAPVLIGALADRSSLAIAMQLSTIGILVSAAFWWRGGANAAPLIRAS